MDLQTHTMDKMKHIIDHHHQHYDEEDDDDRKYTSKNLDAERRRRKKLSDRQLELRSIVPIITNMTKAAIITDAITYIEELQKSVKELSDQLLQLDATTVDKDNPPGFEDIMETEQEMEKSGLNPEVQVHRIGGRKLWIKIICNKKQGGVTKLIEAMTALGFNLIDTNVTTSKGAVLVTSFAEGEALDVDGIKKFLLEIIKSF